MSKGDNEIKTRVVQELGHVPHYAGIGDDGVDDCFVVRLPLYWVVTAECQRRVVAVEMPTVPPGFTTRAISFKTVSGSATWLTRVWATAASNTGAES